MKKIFAYPIELQRFSPLANILTFDRFSTGFNGWMTLMPNFTQPPDIGTRETSIDKSQWPPVMLSSATYRYPGTHGAMSGTYSLKLSTRPLASRYEELPLPGSMGHAIKRLSFHRPKRGLMQLEAWFAYTVEQDRVAGTGDLAGLSEPSVRAFGAGFDIQEGEKRYFAGARYLNSANGELKQRWQVIKATESTDVEWAHGREGEWNRWGVDPMWYGRRYPDGCHDGFLDIPGGGQQLCYNETDCKINWLYFRLLFDTAKREYVELQCEDVTFDLRGMAFTLLAPYARIEKLMNPIFWVENDTNRRVFFYVDSLVISGDS
ncbi:MAG: hypothetical protein DRP71_16815 [Verrucomicrobia bacterium]|nr:MAG: hypothetical protein DRP71_16815 [Verrucomicrobiota bacterium]